MFFSKAKSILKIIKFFVSPSFWEPISNIRIFRSTLGISKTWIFRQALALQVTLSRKELRPRSLGNFYEFGTFKGSSLILMGNLKRLYTLYFPELKNFELYSFDSFEGLPINKSDHNDPVWLEGEFYGSLNEVKKNMKSNSLKANYIKGYYEHSLTEQLAKKMSKFPPSIIHIDVDLYSSTLTVLKWLDKFALPMSLYIFDDIWAVGNHPDLGEQKAINEYNSLKDARGFLIESPLSLGSKTVFSFTLRDYSKDPVYTN